LSAASAMSRRRAMSASFLDTLECI
jgi:hypothetical protein